MLRSIKYFDGKWSMKGDRAKYRVWSTILSWGHVSGKSSSRGMSDLKPDFSEEWVLQIQGGKEFQAEGEKKKDLVCFEDSREPSR